MLEGCSTVKDNIILEKSTLICILQGMHINISVKTPGGNIVMLG